MKKAKTERKTPEQIRKDITAKIVEAIQKGTPPWRQPWVASPNSGPPANFASGRRYTGINPLILFLTSHIEGYHSKFWGTGNSWTKELGAMIKKGERATYVTLFKHIPKKDKETGVVEKTRGGKDKTIPILREFAVFNVEQLTAPEEKVLLGVPFPFSFVRVLLGDYSKTKRTTVTTKEELLKLAQKFAVSPVKDAKTREDLAALIRNGIQARIDRYKANVVVVNTDPDFGPAEELMAKSGAKIKFGGSKAFYRSKPSDFIQLPSKRSFDSMSAFYQTAFHELIHWVVNGERIGPMGDAQTYAFNELVAEIGACFTLMELGVPLAEKMVEKSQSYLKEWLSRMGDDPKFIFDASSVASKACDYLLAFVGKANPAYEGGDDEGGEVTQRSVA